MNMKIKSLLILALVSVCTFVQAQLTDYSIFDKKFNFYVANDLGRNGYYDQKPIAELMGTMGEEIVLNLFWPPEMSITSKEFAA